MGNCGWSKDASDEIIVNDLVKNDACYFDRRELRDLLDKWRAENPTGRATKGELMLFFKKLSPSKASSVKADGSNPEIEVLEKVLSAMDTNHDGKIDFQEAVLGLSAFLRGDHSAKVHLLFAALDTDNSNSVSKNELRDALTAQFRLSRHDLDKLGATVDTIFGKADLDHNGTLSFEELMAIVESEASLKLHFTVADEVFHFNSPDASASKRRAALQAIAETQGLCADNGFTPQVAAEVLISLSGLSPVAIGEFLGRLDNDGFAAKCAGLFFENCKFQDTTLDEALRRMSQKLCLPPESQQIDRLVQSFAGVYCRDNPGAFPDEDAVYLTAFAIVMLNADLHSSNNKRKMTKQEFVKNISLAVPALDGATLEGIFDRVALQEIALRSGDTLGGTGTIKGQLADVGRAELMSMLSGMANVGT
eukprot:TRINITY_DN110620_c0_g1_i1.p1 TRINITY_DN110620_c0_g1~~TRINITY_DN110620_c0_g1_i1.p1  ORF type:complete len:421 (-),score=97.51 TRINITY_DN110620_c0_g1_i1:42-1304(-)